MFKIAVKKIFVVFVGAIVGFITGFVIATIAGFVLITILGGIYPTPVTFEELLGNLLTSAILSGSFGAIGGFITGVGVALMGIRPHAKLIWPLILGVGIFLGGLISKEKWLNQDIVQGNWYILFFITIISAIATWLIVRLIERILSQRLTRGGITPWVASGYCIALVFITLITSGLLRFVTVLFHY